VDFDELYRDVVLDHSRRPRNYGELPDADAHVHGDNPSCGDEITLHVKFGDHDDIGDVAFTGNGCSLCMASASMMTQKIKHKPRAEAEALWTSLHELLTAETEPAPDDRLGELQVLQGVRKFPMRVKCATLPWQALRQALEEKKPGRERDI
jgi:nitrogen fixation NifU-like protein